MNNHGLRTKVKVPSEKRQRESVRGSKGKEKPGLVKVSSEKSLKLPVGESQRPPRRSLVVTKKEGKEVESLRSETRRKAKEEKEKTLRKEKSRSNMQDEGKQKQIVEKSPNAPKKSPKNRQRVSKLDLQKVKEAEESSALATAKKSEPAPPLPHLPPLVGPLPLLLPPLGQSLATLHLNLAELAHIRKQVGSKFFHFMTSLSFSLRSQAGGWRRGN